MKTEWLAGLMVLAALEWGGPARAQEDAAAPAATGGEVEAAEPVAPVAGTAAEPAPDPEWVGFVRVLWEAEGVPKAVRLVTGDRLLAVELNATGVKMAKTAEKQKVRVVGTAEARDGRTWLVLTKFRDAAAEPAPKPTPAPAPAPAPAEPAEGGGAAEPAP